MIKVLFVCMGNICRSPTAQGVFEARVRRAGLEGVITADSAGTTGYHVGDSPDTRATRAAKGRGIEIGHYRARKVEPEDFLDYDIVLAMDQANYKALAHMAGSTAREKLHMFLEFAPDNYRRERARPLLRRRQRLRGRARHVRSLRRRAAALSRQRPRPDAGARRPPVTGPVSGPVTGTPATGCRGARTPVRTCGRWRADRSPPCSPPPRGQRRRGREDRDHGCDARPRRAHAERVGAHVVPAGARGASCRARPAGDDVSRQRRRCDRQRRSGRRASPRRPPRYYRRQLRLSLRHPDRRAPPAQPRERIVARFLPRRAASVHGGNGARRRPDGRAPSAHRKARRANRPIYPRRSDTRLLHGDMWTATCWCGRPIAGFVDPACYFGDAEIELAFRPCSAPSANRFFETYSELRPFDRGGFFDARRDLYNLYPLLVHVRLFGGSYVGRWNARSPVSAASQVVARFRM